MHAGDEGHRERPQLVHAIRLDLDGALPQPVQLHQPAQRTGPQCRTREAAGHGRCVDGVIEVGVADQHADHGSGWIQEPVQHGRVREDGPAPE